MLFDVWLQVGIQAWQSYNAVNLCSSSVWVHFLYFRAWYGQYPGRGKFRGSGYYRQGGGRYYEHGAGYEHDPSYSSGKKK